MKVRDVVTPTVVTANPGTPFPELVDQLLRHDISGLPAVDEKGRLVGMVSPPGRTSKRS